MVGAWRPGAVNMTLWAFFDESGEHGADGKLAYRHDAAAAAGWCDRARNGRLFRELLPDSWLRVSGSAKMPQIDQRVSHQLHTVMASLFERKAQQKPFEFVLPREGPLHAES